MRSHGRRREPLGQRLVVVPDAAVGPIHLVVAGGREHRPWRAFGAQGLLVCMVGAPVASPMPLPGATSICRRVMRLCADRGRGCRSHAPSRFSSDTPRTGAVRLRFKLMRDSKPTSSCVTASTAFLVCGVLEAAFRIEYFGRAGQAKLGRKHQHAECGEDLTHGEQATDAAEVSRGCCEQGRDLAAEGDRLVGPRTRETQSMAFLSTAVMELLYSGQLSSNPSWSITSCLSVRTFAGSPSAASRSPS